MKKLFFLFTCCLLMIGVFAQTKGQTNVTDTTCFCCNGFYSLPIPVIHGPATVNCGEKPVYFIKACSGTTIIWSVTAPNTIASGQGTSSITLAPVTGVAYSIAVQLKCGNKVVETKIPVKVNTVQNCTAAFNITTTQLSNGYININAVPNTQNPGVVHYWGIVYNGSYPNCTQPCSAIPLTSFTPTGVWGGWIDASGLLHPYMGTGITTGTTPYGINYSGFPNNTCFKITHYIICCGIMYKQTQCVSIGTSNLKVAQPSVTKSEVEVVSEKELPKEFKKDLPKE